MVLALPVLGDLLDLALNQPRQYGQRTPSWPGVFLDSSTNSAGVTATARTGRRSSNTSASCATPSAPQTIHRPTEKTCWIRRTPSQRWARKKETDSFRFHQKLHPKYQAAGGGQRRTAAPLSLNCSCLRRPAGREPALSPLLTGSSGTGTGHGRPGQGVRALGSLNTGTCSGCVLGDASGRTAP